MRNRDRHRIRAADPGSLDGDHVVQPLQSGGGRDVQSVERGQRLRRLQRRQPRPDLDRAGLRRSRRAVQAAQRDGRRSAAGPGRDAHARSGRARPRRGVSWNAGVFQADNRDDILFVDVRADRLRLLQEFRQDPPPGHRARRQRPRRARSRPAPATRSWTRRIQSEETRQRRRATAPTTQADAGLEGTIDIEPGDRIPLIPRHMFKAYADVQITSAAVGGHRPDRGIRGPSRAATRTTRHEPDSVYYLGPGRSDRPTRVVNLGGPLRLTAGCRSSRRSTTCSIRATTRPRSSAHGVHGDGQHSSRGRCPRSAASSRCSRPRSTRPALRRERGAACASRSKPRIARNVRIAGSKFWE